MNFPKSILGLFLSIALSGCNKSPVTSRASTASSPSMTVSDNVVFDSIFSNSLQNTQFKKELIFRTIIVGYFTKNNNMEIYSRPWVKKNSSPSELLDYSKDLLGSIDRISINLNTIGYDSKGNIIFLIQGEHASLGIFSNKDASKYDDMKVYINKLFE